MTLALHVLRGKQPNQSKYLTGYSIQSYDLKKQDKKTAPDLNVKNPQAHLLHLPETLTFQANTFFKGRSGAATDSHQNKLKKKSSMYIPALH